jgi:hypothetical protein
MAKRKNMIDIQSELFDALELLKSGKAKADEIVERRKLCDAATKKYMADIRAGEMLIKAKLFSSDTAQAYGLLPDGLDEETARSQRLNPI